MASYTSLFLDVTTAFFEFRTLLLCIALFLLFSWLVHAYLTHVKNLPPGPRGWPLIGCIPDLFFIAVRNEQSMHEVFQSLAKKYGPVCCLPMPFGYKVIVISSYKAVHDALTSNELNRRPPFKREKFHEILKGTGVIMSSDESWKEHRRFSLTVLRSFGVGKKNFEEQIATEADFVMREINSFGGNRFDAKHLFCNAVSNVICSVVLGKRFEYDDPEFKRLLYLLENKIASPVTTFSTAIMPFLAKIPFFPTGGFHEAVLLRQQFQDILNEHRASFDSENMRDFIDVYIKEMRMKEGQGISTHLDEYELLAVIDDFFLAGTETTSTTLRWAVLYMIAFPDVQMRVHEEIDNTVGRNRLPKLSDKPQLPYTVAVIHEIQRFASIVHITGPRYADQDVNFQGFTIPRGSFIFPDLFSVTRDKSIWRDPETFRPERFLDEHDQVIKIQENIVFGAGKRVCLGEQLARMELFIFFTHFMHRFAFKKPEDAGPINLRHQAGGALTPFPYQVEAIIRS